MTIRDDVLLADAAHIKAAYDKEGLMAVVEHGLKGVARFELPVRHPFDFRHTFWKPSHFRTGLEVHSRSTSWRSLVCDDGVPLGLRFDWDGAKVVVQVFADRRLSAARATLVKERIIRSYGLQEDISEFLALAADRHATADAVSALGGMRMSCPENVFEIGLLAVLLQNTTIARTGQMLNGLLTNYGGILEFDGVQLKCFFSPLRLAAITSEELRDRCKLGYRAPTVSALAHHFAKRSRSADLPIGGALDQRLREELVEIRGIGPFTASVIASHALRQMSEPALDVWSTRVAARRFRMDEGAAREDVQSRLARDYPRFEALALLYMLEAECLSCPLVPLIPDRCPTDLPGR